MASSPTESRAGARAAEARTKPSANRLAGPIVKSQVYRSMLRHDYVDTVRNRALEITSNVFLHLHPITIPRHALKVTYTFCLGGLTFFLFLVETITGLLLMFYYRPVPEYAYLDMKTLEYAVQFGVVLRNLHRWGAHLMVFAAFLHMLRVFYHRAYRPPRQFNWVVGVVLLLVTLLLSYTGYLLPWDQLAFWGVSVGTNMAKEAPIIGEKIRFLLLGGNIVSENALLRFYVLHCVVLPVALLILISVHIWRVRKDGGVQGPPEDGRESS